MKIVTWNVNGLRARLDYLLSWLRERRPDAVGLQELKLTEEQFPHAELAAEGYHAVLLGQKAWNGVAVLARETPELVHAGLPGQEDLGARLITARVAGVELTTVYCPNGKHTGHEDFGRKLAWFDALAAHLEHLHDPSRPMVLCGDFNVCPGPLDTWNEDALKGSIFHTDEERERIDRLLAWGLSDVYRELHPEGRSFSWWDYRAGAFHRNHGLRIDLVLASRPLMARVRSAGTDRDARKKKGELQPSDHAPVLIEVDA
jgi:exodeoxyribonuclease-3